MKFAKVDPITGLFVSTGTCPDYEELPETDHEGLLVFQIEGSPHEYQFDHETMSLVRVASPVVELRQRLIAERRAPTAEELTQLAGRAPGISRKP